MQSKSKETQRIMPKRIASTSETNKQICLRVDPALLKQADELVPFVTSHTGMKVVQADVLRHALLRGLRSLKSEAVQTGFPLDAPSTTPDVKRKAKR